MRVSSSILFALMAIVLPMAGVQQHFCTATMIFIDCVEECPADQQKDCCNEEHETRSEAPDCMTVAKALPNADLTAQAQVPEMDTEGVFIEVATFGNFPDVRVETVHPLRHRGPPDMRRTYATQRRLLI